MSAKMHSLVIYWQKALYINMIVIFRMLGKYMYTQINRLCVRTYKELKGKEEFQKIPIFKIRYK